MNPMLERHYFSGHHPFNDLMILNIRQTVEPFNSDQFNVEQYLNFRLFLLWFSVKHTVGPFI